MNNGDFWLILLQDGVVLVHCNAGVSRAAAIVIGFLMNSEEISFTSAFSLVKNARPSICPNAGFMEQLRTYQEGKESNKFDNIQELERGDSSWVTFQQIKNNCNFWIGPYSHQSPFFEEWTSKNFLLSCFSSGNGGEVIVLS